MSRRTLVFGDDGSEAADVAWLWVNEHTWPDSQIEVVTVDSEAPVRGALRSERTELAPLVSALAADASRGAGPHGGRAPDLRG